MVQSAKSNTADALRHKSSLRQFKKWFQSKTVVDTKRLKKRCIEIKFKNP